MRNLALLSLLLLAACSSDPITSYMPGALQGDDPARQRHHPRHGIQVAPWHEQIPGALHPRYATDYRYVPRQSLGLCISPQARQREVKEERKLTLFFDNDQLSRVAGDVAATTKEDKQAEAAKPAKAATEIVLDKFDPNAPPIPPSDEKGFFGRMMESVGF